jgi:hypothetical protein
MYSIFIEKGTQDVTDPLRSIDKSLLPVESVEISEEIFLDGDPETDELSHSSTFCKKGSTFLLKEQVLSNTGMPRDRRSKHEKTLTNGMRRTEYRNRSSDGTIRFWHVFIVVLLEAGTT